MQAVHLIKLSKLAFEWHYCLSNLIYDGFKLKKEISWGWFYIGFKSGWISRWFWLINSIIYNLIYIPTLSIKNKRNNKVTSI